MNVQMRNNVIITVVSWAVAVISLLLNNTVLAFFAFGAALVFIFITYIEQRKLTPSQLLPIVILSVIASLGRVAFNFIPQIQPVTAIVIISGAVIGKKEGMLTGILCALISNLFLGHGPWTIWQVISWGVIGLLAGCIGSKKIGWICLYGFAAGFIHGFITDIWTVLYFGEGITLNLILAVYGAGMFFNFLHAAGNVFFLLLLYKPFEKKLKRIRQVNAAY